MVFFPPPSPSLLITSHCSIDHSQPHGSCFIIFSVHDFYAIPLMKLMFSSSFLKFNIHLLFPNLARRKRVIVPVDKIPSSTTILYVCLDCPEAFVFYNMVSR